MTKTYGQIAYEVGAAWIMEHMGDDRPDGGFEPWESIQPRERVYWEEITRGVSQTVHERHAIVVAFAQKYRARNLDTSKPGEVLMSYLNGACEHYSEEGDRCELCGAPMKTKPVAGTLHIRSPRIVRGDRDDGSS